MNGFLEQSPYLYIATDAYRNDGWNFFDRFAAAGFTLVTAVHKIRHNMSKTLDTDIVHEFLMRIDATMRQDILMTLEQAICARAKRFLGSPYSNVSRYIRAMRKDRKFAVVDTTPIANPKEAQNEQAYLNLQTPCRDAYTAC